MLCPDYLKRSDKKQKKQKAKFPKQYSRRKYKQNEYTIFVDVYQPVVDKHEDYKKQKLLLKTFFG